MPQSPQRPPAPSPSCLPPRTPPGPTYLPTTSWSLPPCPRPAPPAARLRQQLRTRQIVLQVALTYAKIARFDYPSDWPTLFHDLMANLSTGSALAVRR